MMRRSKHGYITDSKMLQGPDWQYIPEPGGVGKVFFNKMLAHGDAVAQVDGLTSKADSYRSLLQRCVRTAIAMRSRSITSSDVITICSLNSLDSCVPFIAGLFLGAKPANVHPTMSSAEIAQLLQLVRPKLVFVCPEAVKRMEDALLQCNLSAEVVVFGSSQNHAPFYEFLKPSEEEGSFEPVNIEDDQSTAVIYFTSGTTGTPKAVCLNHYTMLGTGYRFCYMGYNMDMFLSFSSLYWISASLFTTACIYSKGCRVIAPSGNPKIIWELIQKFEITTMFALPHLAIAILKSEHPKEVKTTSCKQFIIGGSPLSSQQMNDIRNMLPGTHVISIYGLTETGGPCIFFQPREPNDITMAYNKPDSCGKPAQGVLCKVVDVNTGELLGPTQEGEIRMKTKLQTNGYYKQDSSGLWDADGFIKSGDVGYFDEDGCIYVVDRIKDLLRYKDWNVPTTLIEGVLLALPYVEAAAVIGLPHSEHGDLPLAVIVVKNALREKIDRNEVLQYVEKRVCNEVRLVGGVKIVDRIPLTPLGKINKRDLRDMILKGDF